MILKIDGMDVDEDNLLTYLIGSDVPGSKVAITVLKVQQKVGLDLRHYLTTTVLFAP
jgi:hypothetical protein